MNVSEREREFPFFGETSGIFFFFLILGSGSLEEFLFCEIIWGFYSEGVL